MSANQCCPICLVTLDWGWCHCPAPKQGDTKIGKVTRLLGDFTPGPWTYYKNNPGWQGDKSLPAVMAKQPNGKGLFYVAQCNLDTDARLIAMAPQMLEGLKMFRHLFNDLANAASNPGIAEIFTKASTRADKIITVAEGGQHGN